MQSTKKDLEKEMDIVKGKFDKEVATPATNGDAHLIFRLPMLPNLSTGIIALIFLFFPVLAHFTTFRQKYPDAVVLFGGITTGFYPLVWSTSTTHEHPK